MRALSILSLSFLLACGKEPERPVAEASADAEPPVAAVDASVPDVSVAAPADASATPTPTPTPGADAGGLTATASNGPLLGDADNGKVVEAAKGETITLLLTANATTGYDWTVAKSPPALGTPETSYIQGGGALGAAGKKKIVFTVKDALPAGEHAVELGYARSFEKGKPPFKTFAFKVRARKP